MLSSGAWWFSSNCGSCEHMVNEGAPSLVMRTPTLNTLDIHAWAATLAACQAHHNHSQLYTLSTKNNRSTSSQRVTLCFTASL